MTNYITENHTKLGYILGIALVAFWGIVYFIPSEDNFKIKNGKIIRGIFKKYFNTKTSNKGYVDYNYNENYFYNNERFLGCLCYKEGQSILIKIDSLDPKNYIFLPDTFLLPQLPLDTFYSSSLREYTSDTTEAFDLDYFPMTQCLKFNIKLKGEIIQMEKLMRTKPNGDKMRFVYYNSDLYENSLSVTN